MNLYISYYNNLSARGRDTYTYVQVSLGKLLYKNNHSFDKITNGIVLRYTSDDLRITLTAHGMCCL